VVQKTVDGGANVEKPRNVEKPLEKGKSLQSLAENAP
jgi:hypothetical protein